MSKYDKLLKIKPYVAAFGGLIVGIKTLGVVKDFLHFLLKPKRKFDFTNLQGSYALISGGANGIGREFALYLAHQGLNLVIIDTDQEALDRLKQEISLKHQNIMILAILLDLSTLKDVNVCEKLRQDLFSLDISILINNVGVGIGSFGYFHRIKLGYIARGFDINMIPFIMLTRLLAQQMKIRKGNHLIINMCSSSSYYPLPYFFLYGASKATIDIFSESLNLEGLNSISLKPSYVQTALIGGRKGIFIIQPKELIYSFWNDISLPTGHWRHRFEIYIQDSLPGWIRDYWINQVQAPLANQATSRQE